jgi:hypothetical protein
MRLHDDHDHHGPVGDGAVRRIDHDLAPVDRPVHDDVDDDRADLDRPR